MTKKELFEELSKMEQVIDGLVKLINELLNTLVVDTNTYQLLRYYFHQSDYNNMLKTLNKGER